jgi:hypothetical protein
LELVIENNRANCPQTRDDAAAAAEAHAWTPAVHDAGEGGRTPPAGHVALTEYVWDWS